jgi:hypothetical protein
MKKFEELTSAEKHKLEKIGMLWELYPEMQESIQKKSSGFEFYPPTDVNIKNPYERPLFYIEYHTWDGKEYTYKICKRVFILPEENYEKALEENGDDAWMLFGIEGHPYTLHEGKVAESGMTNFETREFLQYTIDALNEKIQNDNLKKVDEAWQKQKKECQSNHTEIDFDNWFKNE